MVTDSATQELAEPDRVADGGGDEVAPAPLIAAGRRRFVVAVVAAQALAAIPYLWILWGPWESSNPLRKTAFEDNFYDLQARAIFHGHLYLKNGAVGIEAFVHNGHQYTYFGLFPSLLRMPVLLVTSSLDGKLTPSSMILAWLATGLFGSLLLWRVRFLLRGSAVMGWAEATASGMLMATLMGGSVLVFLAATPYTFNDDLAWSVALTVGSLFALLGVLERPSWPRVVGSGALLVAANLDRLTTGWACALAALLIALWFRLGRGGEEHRQWFAPMLVAAFVALAAGSVVNWMKFGVPFGLPVTDQVWTSVNAYRRRFLAANGNSEVGTAFAPSDALAYLRPDGLRLTNIFPFVTLPSSPASSLFGVLFDRRYRTAGMPASMPLLFLLSCWGSVTAFRRRPVGRIALTRILLLTSASAGGALLLWGYIAERYLADFMPFLALGAAVGLVDIWRREDGRSRRHRVVALGLIGLVGLFTTIANLGTAITPTDEWNVTQTLHYVEAQKAISDVTGHPLDRHVWRGAELPALGPADQLFVVGHCDGLYISNGEDYRTIPLQQYQHTNWLPVERGPAFEHTLRVTFYRGSGPYAPSIPLVTVGNSTVSAQVTSTVNPARITVFFRLVDPNYAGPSLSAVVPVGSTHIINVVADPVTHLAKATMDGAAFFDSPMTGGAPIVVHTVGQGTTGSNPPVEVVDVTPTGPPALCRSLISGD
jgi:hypothetical protein